MGQNRRAVMKGSTALRRILIAATTTVAAIALAAGLPVKKSFAGEQGAAGGSAPTEHGHSGSSTGVGVGIGVNLNSLFGHSSTRSEVVQPVHVAPTAMQLIKIS